MTWVEIAAREWAKRDMAVTQLADLDDALDAALSKACEEVGASETARRLGVSRKTVNKRIWRHRERAA